MHKTPHSTSALLLACLLSACGGGSASAPPTPIPPPTTSPTPTPAPSGTATPIQHLVIIYGENVSFDHYFGTYPTAANPSGEPAFSAAAGTPAVNGFTAALLTHNPNLNSANGSGASNPFRLDRSEAATADQDHDYSAEQSAEDGGKADLFPASTGGGSSQVMGYYDGNTVTALWNYAQHFAMSDNAYSDTYGPSTPGALALISGQTDGASGSSGATVDDGQGGATVIADADPAGDACSGSPEMSMSGKNIGDLLSAAGVSWGWFEGGFNLGATNADGSSGCNRSNFSAVVGAGTADYVPHHEPFQFYASTANPNHTRPASTAAIGTNGDGANHQYDLQDFFAAVKAGNFPAVAFLKASAFEDGHAGYSDPLDEQTFVTEVVNFLEQQPAWHNTAVLLLYDDSDGWYDHAFLPPGNGSFDPSADELDGAGSCGAKGSTAQLGGVAGSGPVNGRCGPGMRQPFLVISPWAKPNYVDHALITQSSVLRFIEDNWLSGKRLGSGSFDAGAGSLMGMFNFTGSGSLPPLYLDNGTGEAVTTPSGNLPP